MVKLHNTRVYIELGGGCNITITLDLQFITVFTQTMNFECTYEIYDNND